MPAGHDPQNRIFDRAGLLAIAGTSLAWTWTLLAGGGGLMLLMEKGPWPLGDKFTTADVAIGGGVPWAFRTGGTLPRESPFKEYAERIEARPAYQRSQARIGVRASRTPASPPAARTR